MCMELYAITRRHGWASASELEAAVARSQVVCEDEMTDRVRWIRSYVLEEGDGSLGTICLFAAVSPEAIRKHARLAGLPVAQIARISDTVIIPPVTREGPGREEREVSSAGWLPPTPALRSNSHQA
jgi:Protein of unknown function (DUF4242)